MKKNVLIALLGLSGLMSAQQGNDALKRELAKDAQKTLEQFDFYAQKKIYQTTAKGNAEKLAKIKKDLSEKRNKVAFFFQGKPYYLKAFDKDQITNSNTDFLQEGTLAGLDRAYNGKGIKVTVFDGGRVYAEHQDFGDKDRITNKENATMSYSSHATGVTGMIGSKGSNIRGTVNGITISGNTKGVMPEATFDVYSFTVTTLPGDSNRKNVNQKLNESQALLSNHSYGGVIGWNWDNQAGDGWYWEGYYDTATRQSYDLNGVYGGTDKSLDDIVYNNPNMIVVKAASNSFGDGPNGTTDKKFYEDFTTGNWIEFNPITDIVPENNCASGYDCIPSGTVAKNIIVVGSTEKITTNNGRYTSVGDITKSSFSSAGPRDDGAIKPDVAGVGSGIFYPSTNAVGSERYGWGSGTSFSAPQVTGIIGLWSEMYQSYFNGKNLNAASAKNLLIHSAQEAGSIGPDVWYGWGFADAKKGAELILEKSKNTIIFEDKTLSSGVKNEMFLKTDGSKPLKVSIVWTDPSHKDIATTHSTAHNVRTPRLINDLDLRLVNMSTNVVYYPWKLNISSPMASATKGDNVVDNVEQVLIETPTAGTYRVEVSNKGNLVDNDLKNKSTQVYSIIATGYTRAMNSLIETNEIAPTLLTEGANKVQVNFLENIKDISVYDMVGRLVRKVTPNKEYFEIDFSGLPAGIYVINATSDNHKLSKKIRKE